LDKQENLDYDAQCKTTYRLVCLLQNNIERKKLPKLDKTRILQKEKDYITKIQKKVAKF